MTKRCGFSVPMILNGFTRDSNKHNIHQVKRGCFSHQLSQEIYGESNDSDYLDSNPELSEKMVPPQIIQPFSIGIFHLNHPAIGVVVPTAPVGFQAHQDGVALGGVRKVLGDGSSH